MTMAAPRSAVMEVANAPARKCVTFLECSRDITASAASRCGKKTRAFSFHNIADTAASRTNPGQITPTRSRKEPSRRGGKKPPSPPIAPTRPVTTPVFFGKYCGTSLNTPPFPNPSRTAHPNCSDAERKNGRRRHDECEWNDSGKDAPEHACATDAIGKPAANGPHARRDGDKSGCAESGIA